MLVVFRRVQGDSMSIQNHSETEGIVLEPDLPIIDSHHHLWIRDGKQYLQDEFARDVSSGHNILATVFVECGAMYRSSGPSALFPVGEAEFVAGVAAMSDRGHFGRSNICAAFVGAADLTLGDAVDDVLGALEQASAGRLRGIRGAVAWDADKQVNPRGRFAESGLLLDPKFQAGAARLNAKGLVYDAWQYHPQLPELCSFVDRFAQMPVVINHCGGPLGSGSYSAADTFEPWKAHMIELARRPNTIVKLGGMSGARCGLGFERLKTQPTVSELAAAWRPYIETCIEQFGPARCMFESNFPPDNVVGSYRKLWNALKLTVMGYSDSEKRQLFHDTAARVYHIS